ncbi:MAG: peptidase M23, partial [Enterococcus casseliflavus]|nr:peptidase M23 [Enterococcus casseliflavus]
APVKTVEVTPAAPAAQTATAPSNSSSAKEWIANKESGGSYTATNGRYIGRYQLDASYLNGDYSAANQEKVADEYVASRYGSWSAAKAFWEANGWY